MADLAVDNEDGRDVTEAEVATGLFFRARQQAPETIEPAMRHLHHPTPRRVTIGVSRWWQWGGLAPLGRDVHRVTPHDCRLPTGLVVIAPVQRQLGRLHWRRW